MTMTQRGSSRALYKAKLARQIEKLRENGETASDYSNHSRYRLSCCRKKLVWVLHRFCLKKVIDFAHFGLESGVVFEGATVVYEHICRLVPNEKKISPKYANSVFRNLIVGVGSNHIILTVLHCTTKKNPCLM